MSHCEPVETWHFVMSSNVDYSVVCMGSKYENLRATESDLLAHVIAWWEKVFFIGKIFKYILLVFLECSYEPLVSMQQCWTKNFWIKPTLSFR